MPLNGYTIIDESTLTNIADAIRGKTGETATLTPAEMAEAIQSIGVAVFVWSWSNPIHEVVISADHVAEYETYGTDLTIIGLGIKVLTLTASDSHDIIIGWLNYLPSGGHASIVLSDTGKESLSDAEKAVIVGKGYTIV